MKSGKRGFTLVEMLVAISLLSVLMVALGSAMRTMAQTEARVDQRLQRSDTMRVTGQLLHQLLGRQSWRKWPAPAARGGPPVTAFRATPDSIEWVGVLPARHGAGGRSFMRLKLEELDGNTALVLRFHPWDVQAVNFPDWNQTNMRTLATGITEFAVQAQGLPPSSAVGNGLPPQHGWQPGWPEPTYLPERIQLTLVDDRGPWPELVIPVNELGQGTNIRGGFSIGGSR